MDIEPERVADLADAQLIDVRSDHEWDAGHIAGARHIVLGEVAAQAESIRRDAPVVFICRVGGRSTLAADAFARAGYEAYSLAGGMLAWDARGLPYDGVVAEH